MAGTNVERLIFSVETVVSGQQDLIRLSESLVKIQSEQAATAQKSAVATAKMATELDGLAGKEVNAASKTTALSTAFLALNDVFHDVMDVAHTVFESLQAISETGFQTDRWQAQFEILEHSPDRARESLEKFEAFARQYNLPTEQVVEAAAHLQRVGLLTDQSLKTVANASLTYHKSMAEVASILAGVARGNLRGYLDMVNASTSGVLKAQQAMDRGVRMSGEALHGLGQLATQELGTNAAGAVERFAETTEAKLVGVDDRFEDLRKRIYASGWGEAMGEVVDVVIEELDRMARDGSMQQWAQMVGDTVRFGADALTKLIRILPPLIDLLRFVGPIAAAAALSFGVGLLVAALGEGVLALVRFNTTVGITGQILPGIASTMSAFGVAVYETLGPLGLAALAVTGVMQALKALDEQAAKPFKLDVDVQQGARSQLVAEQQRLRGELDKNIAKQKEYKEIVDATLAGSQGERGNFVAQRNLEAQTKAAKLARDEIESLQTAIDKIDAGPGLLPGSGPGELPALPTKPNEDALKEAVRASREAQRAMVEDANDATRIVMDQVKQRLDATGAEGEARVALLAQFAREEYDALIASGTLRTEKQTEIEQETADRRVAIMATTSGKAQEIQLQELAASRNAQLLALDAAYSTGLVDRKLAQANADAKSDAQVAADRRAAAESARLAVEDARFERELYGETSEQYVRQLEARLVALRKYSAEAIAIQKELEAARRALDRDTERDAVRVTNLVEAGASPEEAPDMVRREREASKVAQYARDEETATYLHRVALLDDFKGIHDKAWADMSETEKKTHLDNLALARDTYTVMSSGFRGAYDTIKKTVVDLATSEQKRLQVARVLTQQGAKEAIASALEQASGELKARALVAAVDTLMYLARGQLHAAALSASAAALAGAEGLVAGGLARGVRSSIAEDERDRQGTSATGEAQNAARGSAGIGLTVSQGNVPITLNFYNNVSFIGGAMFFGREGARDFVQLLIPEIQAAFDNGQIRVAA